VSDRARPLLHLIDGSGYIFRAFYAMRGLATSKGEPTNAVYIFTTMIQKAIAEEKPTHLAIAFDPGRKNFRSKIYSDYKAHRPPPPDDLLPQIPRIRQVTDTFRIPVFCPEGYEADDVLATLARMGVEAGYDVRIITGDKDMMQLVGDHVSLYDPMRDKRSGAKEVEERFGVPPNLVRDVLALAGDSIDNIPGVKGVGEKTASKLLAEHKSLDGLIEAAKKGLVKGKLGEKIVEAIPQIEISKQLVALDDRVPLDKTIEELVYVGPDYDQQRVLFEELEFRRLIQQPAAGTQNAAIRGEGPVRVEPITHERYTAITSSAGLKELADELARAKMIAIAVETSSARIADAEVYGLAFAVEPGVARYIPLGHIYLGSPKQLTIEEVLEAVRPAIEQREIPKAALSLKTAYELFARHGISMSGLAYDAEIASYLLEPDDGPHDERAVGRRFLSHQPISRDDLLGRGKQKRGFSELTIEEGTKLVGEAADMALRSVEPIRSMLEGASLLALNTDLEVPLISVIGDLELAGVKIDVEQLTSMSGTFEAELSRLEKACYEAAGQEFNLGSPKQLQKVLYEDLGLRIVKRTKTGPSTDASVLEALVDDHPLPQSILEYRQVQKLKSTYVDALPRMVSPKTGRVHTVMNQAVAATGRLSSTDPNLQNIPIRTELGRQLRRVFVAEPKRKLISVDYSQIELRVMAHFSADPVLTDAFKTGMDVHTRTASVLFEVDPKDVTSVQRGQAKTVNFGVLYGMGPMRLARQLGMQRRAASKFIEDYFQRQPGVQKYIEDTLKTAREEGFIRTLLGRRRRVPDINSKNRALRTAAERIAVNSPIQGSAADLVKLAMLRVRARLLDEHPDVALILQVHDELLLESPEGKVEEVAALVKREMEQVYPLDVPLVADVHHGFTWDEAH
jgi:DNA polymerase I